MALIDPCLYLQADAHPARSFRAVITETWDEGVMSLADMVVSQRGAGAGGPNFSIDISAGRAVVQGDADSAQGNYMCTNDDVANVAVSSAPSAGNERFDLVVLEVQDNAEDSGGVNAPRFRVVAGTPASEGSASSPALPDTCLLLATIGPIVNATTTITDSLITRANLLAGRRATPGTLEWLAGLNIPNGWLNCNGQAVSRATYARLFAQIGTDYGDGDGSTTFNLPNLGGKVAVSRNASWPETDAVGESGGARSHTLTSGEMPAHVHSGPAHVHSIAHNHPVTSVRTQQGNSLVGFIGGGGTGQSIQAGTSEVGVSEFRVDLPNYTGNSGAASSANTGSAGSGGAHNNMQPYLTVGVCVIRA